MNFSDYDKAVESKLLSVFPNVVNSSAEKSLENSEDDMATVKLPLISFWRLTNTVNENFYNAPMSLIGGEYKKDKDKGKSLFFRSIPFTLTYQIDIFSDRLYEADQILSELLLYFVDEPYLTVQEQNTDNENIEVSFKVTDTDMDIDLTDFSERGKLYQQIITIEIDNASIYYPKNVSLVKNIPLRGIIIQDKEGNEYHED